jgi:hypothetical protein
MRLTADMRSAPPLLLAGEGQSAASGVLRARALVSAGHPGPRLGHHCFLLLRQRGGGAGAGTGAGTERGGGGRDTSPSIPALGLGSHLAVVS